MKIADRHLSNRAISQIISALLLIAITVTAAVLLYIFSIGLLGSLGSGGAQELKEQVIMEGYSFPTSGPLTVSVRNVGPSSVNIGGADWFIAGVKGTMSAPPSGSSCVSATLTPQQSCAANVALSGGYSSLISGASYALRIVTPDGGEFSYPITYGGSS